MRVRVSLTRKASALQLTDPKLPWETCLTMGDSWAFTNNSYDKSARYMNATKVIQSLVDVVAKGGNMLLDIGPVRLLVLPAFAQPWGQCRFACAG